MVEYEIHLHPTYRVPCLWFTLRNLPADEPAFDVDTVFRRLVPDEYKAGLRALGNVGGISADVSFETRDLARSITLLRASHPFLSTHAC
jgi:ubiquitin-like-conjugating enzyme ATG10